MKIFVLCRSKRSNRTWSAYIARRLTALGYDAYRVTPDAVPMHRVENARLIINYGTGRTPIWWSRVHPDCVVLNDPSQVRVSVNKIEMQRALERECSGHHLDYYLSKEAAQQAIDNGETIVARTLLSSHSGNGIVLSPPDPLPDARLYTVLKRWPGLREYRIWFKEGKMMDVVCKKRKGRASLLEFCTPEEADSWWNSRFRQVVRAWKNGWAFCHNNLPVDDNALFTEIAETASRILTWGCVDVLIDNNKQWYIVETNSAPGLDAGNTQTMFIESFIESAQRLGINRQ